MVKQCCKCKKLDFLNPKVSFHKLPIEMEKRKVWLNILGINKSIPKLSDVCSDHFEEKDFTCNERGKRALKNDALPKEEVIKNPYIEDNSLQTKLHEPKVKSEVMETVTDTQHAQGFEEYETVIVKSEIKEEEEIEEREDIKKIQDNRLEPATFVDQNNTQVKTEPVDRDMNLDVNEFIDYAIKNEEVLFKEEPGEAGTNDNSNTEMVETNDSYGEENMDNLLNLMKTDENSSETTQHEPIDGEDDLGYTTYLIYNGINIKIENKKKKVIENRTKPFNASELSKRYREKLKQDPERRAKYLLKVKEKNRKRNRKSSSSPGEVKVTMKEDPPIKKEHPTKIPENRPKQTRKPHLYKCNRCVFETKYKQYIKVHVLRHKNPEENEMVKCANCDYKTIYKPSLRKHILRHRDPEEVKKYHCEICGYRTLSRDNLKRHSLIHKDETEVVFHKCPECDFQTVHKGSLKKHSVRHKNDEFKTYKCVECDFQTMRKDSIKVHHVLRHQIYVKV